MCINGYFRGKSGFTHQRRLSSLFGIEKIIPVSLSLNKHNKNFTLLQISSKANCDDVLASVKIVLGNSSIPRSAFWSSGKLN